MGTGNVQSVAECGVNELYYFDRDLNRVCYVEEGKVKYASMEGIFKCRKDSAIFFVSSFEFVVAGGVKPSGAYSKKVVQVNYFLKTVKKLTSLPLGTCFGSLVQNVKNLYLCGAVFKREDIQHPCPLLKLNIDTGKWEILAINDILVETNHSFSNTLKPKCCVLGNKLFLFGGLKANTQKLTKKIFFIDLSQTVPKYQEETFKCPIKFVKLNCCISDNFFYIGGQDLQGKVLLMKKNFNNGEWIQLGTFQVNIKEDYPVQILSKKIVFFNYPLLVILEKQQINTYEFDLAPFNSGGEEKKSVSIEKKQSLKNPRISEKSSRSKKKKLKTQLSTHYSKSTAPMLPSNIIKQMTFHSSSSNLSSSISDSSISSSSSSS